MRLNQKATVATLYYLITIRHVACTVFRVGYRTTADIGDVASWMILDFDQV